MERKHRHAKRADRTNPSARNARDRQRALESIEARAEIQAALARSVTAVIIAFDTRGPK